MLHHVCHITQEIFNIYVYNTVLLSLPHETLISSAGGGNWISSKTFVSFLLSSFSSHPTVSHSSSWYRGKSGCSPLSRSLAHRYMPTVVTQAQKSPTNNRKEAFSGLLPLYTPKNFFQIENPGRIFPPFFWHARWSLMSGNFVSSSHSCCDSYGEREKRGKKDKFSLLIPDPKKSKEEETFNMKLDLSPPPPPPSSQSSQQPLSRLSLSPWEIDLFPFLYLFLTPPDKKRIWLDNEEFNTCFRIEGYEYRHFNI